MEARLLAATERLLAQGYQFGALSVEQLAAEAGFSRATFYLHFRDKGEMVARIMGQLMQELVQSNGEWLGNGTEFTPDILRKAIAGTVSTFKKHQTVVAAIMDTAPFDEAVRAQCHKMLDQIIRQSHRSFSMIQKDGQGRAETTDEVIEVLTWMVFLYTSRFVHRHDGSDIERLSKTLGHIGVTVLFGEGSK